MQATRFDTITKLFADRKLSRRVPCHPCRPAISQGGSPMDVLAPPIVRLRTPGSLQAVGAGPGYPTLTLIDHALNDPTRSFADGADAPWLEDRARELTTEYWGDTVWLTGGVAEPAFRRVVDELERLKASGTTAPEDRAA